MAKKKKKRFGGFFGLLALVVIGVAVYLILSSRIFGSYTAEANVLGFKAGSMTYTFSGLNKVEVNVEALGNEVISFEGKYAIKDNTITITVPSSKDDAKSQENAENAKDYVGEHEFFKGKDEIKIDGTTYKKVK